MMVTSTGVYVALAVVMHVPTLPNAKCLKRPVFQAGVGGLESRRQHHLLALALDAVLDRHLAFYTRLIGFDS